MIRKFVFDETDDFMAVYNRSPILPGHVLIVTKYHVSSLLDLDENLLSRFFRYSRRITSVLLKVFNATAFNWSLQDHTAAGQTVDHLHLHILPRKDHDLNNPGDWYKSLYGGENSAIDSEQRLVIDDNSLDIAIKQIKSML